MTDFDRTENGLGGMGAASPAGAPHADATAAVHEPTDMGEVAGDAVTQDSVAPEEDAQSTQAVEASHVTAPDITPAAAGRFGYEGAYPAAQNPYRVASAPDAAHDRPQPPAGVPQHAYETPATEAASRPQATTGTQAWAAPHAADVLQPAEPEARKSREGGDDGNKGKGKPKWPIAVGGAAVGAIVAGFAVAAALGGTPSIQAPGSPVTPKTEQVEEGTPEVARPAELDRSGDASIASAVAKRCLPSVVSIMVTSGGSAGQASGVVIDDAGHVLTNSHVVKDMDTITIVTPDGEEYEGTLMGLDDSSDLAVVSVDWKGATVTPIEWGKSGDLEVGDWVMTIGSPYGLDQSVSAGIVSALSRNEVMESYDGYRLYANLIQTDAAINTGNSGGALVDEEGKLVGINAMLVSSSGSFSGIGFAIPADYARHVSDQIIAGKDVTHAYIGGKFSDVRPQYDDLFGRMSQGDLYGNGYDRNGHVQQRPEDGDEQGDAAANVTQGAVVAEVAADGPAAKAGLRKDDIITRIDDDKITSATSLVITVRSHEIGDKVDVEYIRDGKVEHAEVTLGSDEGINASSDSDASDPGATVGDGGKVERNGQGYGNGYGNGGYDEEQIREFMEFFDNLGRM